MLISAKTTRLISFFFFFFFFFTKRSVTTILAITKIISPKYCGVKMREPKKTNVGYYGTPLMQLSVYIHSWETPNPAARFDVAVLTTMHCGCKFLNLNSKFNFQAKFTIIFLQIFWIFKQPFNRHKSSIPSQMQQYYSLHEWNAMNYGFYCFNDNVKGMLTPR